MLQVCFDRAHNGFKLHKSEYNRPTKGAIEENITSAVGYGVQSAVVTFKRGSTK